MSNPDFVQRSIDRFWRNLKNGIMELLKTNVISEETTIKDLLKVIGMKGG